MGRKPLNELAKNKVIPVRLTDSEHTEIETAAQTDGTPVSTFVRDAALSRARATPPATPAKKRRAKPAKPKDS